MDTVLGLLGLLIYMAVVIGIACAVTYAVVKLSPSKAVKDQEPKPTAD
jgi:hypothetical protein